MKGLYFFTFTSYSSVNEQDIGVMLMKNSEEVLLVWEWQDKDDDQDYASYSVLLELEVKDMVYMLLREKYPLSAKRAQYSYFQWILVLPIVMEIPERLYRPGENQEVAYNLH